MRDAENQTQDELKSDAETANTAETTKAAKSGRSTDALVIVDLAEGDGEAWFARLQRAGQPWKPRVLTTLADARVTLGEWESHHLLICYRSPLKQLEIDLAKDTPPAQAVVNWKESTEALLQLYRRHWKRITLVEQDAAIRKEGELLKHLEQRTGLTLAVPQHDMQAYGGPESDGPESNESTGSPMYELIAMQLLNMRKSRSLFQELEASSLPLSERPDIIQLVENALNSGKSRTQLAEERLEAERLALTAERDKLRSEAGLTKQELEKERKTLLAEKKELQQENDLIIEQLHKTQEELEQYYLKLKKTEGDIKTKNQKLQDFSQRTKQLKAQLETAKADLKRIRNSRSWKITAPLRRKAKRPVEPK